MGGEGEAGGGRQRTVFRPGRQQVANILGLRVVRAEASFEKELGREPSHCKHDHVHCTGRRRAVQQRQQRILPDGRVAVLVRFQPVVPVGRGRPSNGLAADSNL